MIAMVRTDWSIKAFVIGAPAVPRASTRGNAKAVRHRRPHMLAPTRKPSRPPKADRRCIAEGGSPRRQSGKRCHDAPARKAIPTNDIRKDMIAMVRTDWSVQAFVIGVPNDKQFKTLYFRHLRMVPDFSPCHAIKRQILFVSTQKGNTDGGGEQNQQQNR